MQLKRYGLLFLAVLVACMIWLRPAWAGEPSATDQNPPPIQNDQPAAVPGAAQTSAASSNLPLAHFPELAYSFQPVVEGTDVSHEFVVQNQGSAVLDITNVKTG
jgi:hypothetical protein